jgi:hypothetical protein
MDDLTNHETSGARVATLPPRGLFSVELGRRQAAREAFIRRADAWAVARAGGDRAAVVITHPVDEAVIIALGVPCDDCFGLVYAEGEDGHHVRFGMDAGRHWAALISARCGRRS